MSSEIVLSLSPGAAPIEKLEEMREYAQMWRISDDIWDIWHSEVPYPQGLGDQFSNTILWAGLGQPGRWPDADMLPLGYLGPSPGWGSTTDTPISRRAEDSHHFAVHFSFPPDDRGRPHEGRSLDGVTLDES